MPDDHARRVMELFEAALAIDPAERARWLDDACAEDDSLREEVAALLALHTQADNFLQPDGVDAEEPEPRPTDDQASPTSRHLIGPGTRLGDFLIEEQIGAGSMGVVYRARQVSLNRLVALKVLPAYLRYSATARARFRREVEAVARLHHTNIVAVYTTGEENGTAFYAMELIDGPPLNEIIAQLRRDPVPELRSSSIGRHSGEDRAPTHVSDQAGAAKSTPMAAVPDGGSSPASDSTIVSQSAGQYFDTIVTMLADVADALAYAHRNQVVHRDIKPSNLLLSKDGRLHISDFGLARILEEPGVTQTGEFVGTPFYMAPEQISANTTEVDGRADIYSLGATLYELLTLRPPFPGKSRDQVIAQISHVEATSPRRLNRRIPRDLDTICLKALEKDPNRRYQAADQMASDLRNYVNRFAISARRSGPIAKAVKWSRRHRAQSAMLVGACFLALTALFFAHRLQVSQSRWTQAQQQEVFETALLSAMIGELDDAHAAIDQAADLGAPEGKIQLLNGLVTLRNGQFPAAYEHSRRAVELMPDDLAARCLLIMTSMQEQLFEEAASIWDDIRSSTPNTLEEQLLLGQVQMYDDPVAGLRRLDEAVLQHRDSVVARLLRGSVRTGRAVDTGDPSDIETALEDLAIVGELIGANPYVLSRQMRAHLAAATIYEATQQPAERQKHLRRAAELAEEFLQFPAEWRSRVWRAFYFDYIAEDAKAVAQWQHLREQRIFHLVLTLFRMGQYEEALAVCEERLRRHETARWTKFLRALVLSAVSDSPQAVRRGYEIGGETSLDPAIEHLFTHIVLCIAGQPEEAKKASRRLRDSQPSLLHDKWYQHLLEFTSGDRSAEELLVEAGASRTRQNQGHLFIGVTLLSEGDRQAALSHFKQSADLRIMTSINTALSRGLLAQMERDPDWPSWIPAK